MTQFYKVTGMTCEGCKAKVNQLLSSVSGVRNLSIDLTKWGSSCGNGKAYTDHPACRCNQGFPQIQVE
ncbi:hypothetical protein BH09BAC3_BH09BAC3_06740 [soil metagenome]